MNAKHNQDDGRPVAAGISRRSVLVVGAVGIPGVALAACSQAKSPSGDNSTTAGAGSSDTGSSSGGDSSSAQSSSAGSGAASSPAAQGGSPLAKLSDIKVGEAVAAKGADGKPIIIARPSATTVAAFSAICTHQGCTVAPAGKELDCPCHGSVYNATTGQVINGPAPRPLSPVKVSLSGDNVIAG
jgi:cytochrome b6-f complex iron-sulfur subunit